MIQRIVHTVLTLICIISVTNQTHAGVITGVETGIVTKYATNDGTNVQFVNASFNTLTTGTTAVDIMPWIFQPAEPAETYQNGLLSDLNAYTLTTLDTDIIYIFANKDTPGGIDARAVYYDGYGSTWLDVDFYANEADTAFPTGSNAPYYYAILDTGGNSSVPEPSTAIAMGLLGIVGFAGNRRRRRQVSVA